MKKKEFRVWDGLEMVYDVMVGKFGVFYVNPGDKGDGLDPKDTASLTPFNTKYHDDTLVMEFTGLLDKNGNKIFEGDILENFTTGISGVVEWSDELALFQTVQKIDGQEFTATIYSHQKDSKNTNREVVGNIYQNPDLMHLISS